MKASSTKRSILILLFILLSAIVAVEAQEQRMMEFQEMFSKYQTQYRQLMKSGQHKDAVVPLKTRGGHQGTESASAL